jgi:hypothetical protein
MPRNQLEVSPASGLGIDAWKSAGFGEPIEPGAHLMLENDLVETVLPRSPGSSLLPGVSSHLYIGG